MAFWSSEKLKQTLTDGELIEPFDVTAVKHGAYELSLGPEAFLTSDDDERKKSLKDGEQLVIPPGQFGLLLTEEKVAIPNNAIGFISIKAGIKFRGLVNVSGFHVDPGFSGRLKFSVYNAGSQNIVLQRKQRVFLLWFSDLDQPTNDVYVGTHSNQNEISSADVMLIQGAIASPGQLKHDIQDLEKRLDKEIKELAHKFENMKWVLSVLFTAVMSIVTGLLVVSLRGCVQVADKPALPNQAITQSMLTTTNAGSVQFPAPTK